MDKSNNIYNSSNNNNNKHKLNKNQQHDEILFWRVYHNRYIRHLIFNKIKTMHISFASVNEYLGNRIPFKLMNKLSLLVKKKQWTLLEYKLDLLRDSISTDTTPNTTSELIINPQGLQIFIKTCFDINLIDKLFQVKLQEITALKTVFGSNMSLVVSILNQHNPFQVVKNCTLIRYLLSRNDEFQLPTNQLDTISYKMHQDTINCTTTNSNLLSYFVRYSKCDQDLKFLEKLLFDQHLIDIPLNAQMTTLDETHTHYQQQLAPTKIDTKSYYNQSVKADNKFTLTFLISNKINNGSLYEITIIEVLDYLVSYQNKHTIKNEEIEELSNLTNQFLNFVVTITTNQKSDKQQIIGFRIFHMCSRYGNLKIAKMIIENHSIYPEISDLEQAISSENIEIFNYYLSPGVNVNLTGSEQSNYSNLFRLANNVGKLLIRKQMIQSLLDSQIYVGGLNGDSIIDFNLFVEIQDEKQQMIMVENNMVSSVTREEMNEYLSKKYNDNYYQDPLYSNSFELYLNGQFNLQSQYSSDCIGQLSLIKLLETNTFTEIQERFKGYTSKDSITKTMISLIFNLFRVRKLITENLKSMFNQYQQLKWFIEMDESNHMIALIPFNCFELINSHHYSMVDKMDYLGYLIDNGLVRNKIATQMSPNVSADQIINNFYPFDNFANYQQVQDLIDKFKHLGGTSNCLILIFKSYFNLHVIPNCDQVSFEIFENLLKSDSSYSTCFAPMRVHSKCLCCHDLEKRFKLVNGSNGDGDGNGGNIITDDQFNSFIESFKKVVRSLPLSNLDDPTDSNEHEKQFKLLEVCFILIKDKTKLFQVLCNDDELKSKLVNYILNISSETHHKLVQFILKRLDIIIGSDGGVGSGQLNITKLFVSFEKSIEYKYPIKLVKMLFDKIKKISDSIHIGMFKSVSYKSVELILKRESSDYYRQLFKLALSNNELFFWNDKLASPLSFSKLFDQHQSISDSTISNLFNYFKINSPIISSKEIAKKEKTDAVSIANNFAKLGLNENISINITTTSSSNQGSLFDLDTGSSGNRFSKGISSNKKKNSHSKVNNHHTNSNFNFNLSTLLPLTGSFLTSTPLTSTTSTLLTTYPPVLPTPTTTIKQSAAVSISKPKKSNDVIDLIRKGKVYRALELIAQNDQIFLEIGHKEAKKLIKYYDFEVVEKLVPFFEAYKNINSKIQNYEMLLSIAQVRERTDIYGLMSTLLNSKLIPK